MNTISLFIVLPLAAVLVFNSACTNPKDGEQNTSQVSKQKEKPFEYCEAHSNCSDFRDYEAKCRTGQNEKDCREFVGLFEKLAVKNDCRRKFDKEPVPSVWICDEDVEETTFPKLFERSAKTLSKLKYPFARKFYGSKEFRSTLDGAVAEDHSEESMKIKN